MEALQRERAEFINFRNRAQKEQERFRQHGITILDFNASCEPMNHFSPATIFSCSTASSAGCGDEPCGG